MTEQPINSNYWMWHFSWVVIWPVFVLLFIVYILSDLLAVIIYMGVAIFMFAAAWGSLIGYWVEAKRLKEAESDWVPMKWLYIIGHIFLSPFIVAPVYFIRRWQKIGIPWGDLPGLGGR